MESDSPEAQLAGFLAKYTPEIVRQAEEAIGKMWQRLPGAIAMVYDNYNALVVGFGPTDRASEAIYSIAIYPRYCSLCFLQGANVPDPQGLLQGSGNVVRHIRLDAPETLDRPEVQALLDGALASAAKPLDPTQPGKLVIKSISAKQRPRRPSPRAK
jgi:hypothetical protein